jgi:hypothetical protein
VAERVADRRGGVPERAVADSAEPDRDAAAYLEVTARQQIDQTLAGQVQVGLVPRIPSDGVGVVIRAIEQSRETLSATGSTENVTDASVRVRAGRP